MLFGDGDMSISEEARHIDKGGWRRPVPLHVAIARAKDGRGTADDGVLARATVQEVNDTAFWLAERFFADGWAVMSKEARMAVEDAAKAAGKPPPDAMSHFASQLSRGPPPAARTHTMATFPGGGPLHTPAAALPWPTPWHAG